MIPLEICIKSRLVSIWSPESTESGTNGNIIQPISSFGQMHYIHCDVFRTTYLGTKKYMFEGYACDHVDRCDGS